jgi:hypothetical protein
VELNDLAQGLGARGSLSSGRGIHIDMDLGLVWLGIYFGVSGKGGVITLGYLRIDSSHTGKFSCATSRGHLYYRLLSMIGYGMP